LLEYTVVDPMGEGEEAGEGGGGRERPGRVGGELRLDQKCIKKKTLVLDHTLIVLNTLMPSRAVEIIMPGICGCQ